MGTGAGPSLSTNQHEPVLPPWRESGEDERSASGAEPASPGFDMLGLIGHALSLDGARYRPGGNSPEGGFDCSGFVSYLFSRQGIRLPRSSAEQFNALPDVERSSLRPGDLVFFRTAGGKRVSHVGLFLGGDRFIHATSSSTRRVMVSTLEDRYWRRTWAGARRVPPAAELAAAQSEPVRLARHP
jgi:murein DD-endopeptidase